MRRLLMSGIVGVLIFAMYLAACGAPPVDSVRNDEPVHDEGESENEPEDQPAEQIQETVEEEKIVSTPMIVQPQVVEIPTEDGRMLEGLFYPPAVENASVVVLMHWAPGDMDDWSAIAPWLQSGLAATGGIPGGGGAPFLDINWFPQMPKDASFGVLAFNFGRYGSSEYGGSRESYVTDGVAALTFAASQPGANPDQLVAIGASIGADGAVDACYQFNQSDDAGTCIGTFSLSPGNYLTDAFTYPEAAAELDAAGYPVWCLAAERDGPSPGLCRSLDGDHTRSFIFEGGDHGMDLLSPDQLFLEPPLTGFDTMQVLQEFLETALGVSLNENTIP
jgi:hypothetical protein